MPSRAGAIARAQEFFDSNGFLFSGGGGVTVFRPDGTVCYDQPCGSADGYYATVTYDPANDEVLKIAYGGSSGTLYHAASFEAAPEPSTLILLLAGSLAALACRWRRAAK